MIPLSPYRASMRLAALSALLLAAPGLAAPVKQPARQAPQVTANALRAALYSYDPTLALHPVLEEMPSKSEALANLRTRYHLVYDSVHDQKVTAIVSIPKNVPAPYAAVVLLAGSGGHKDSDYVRIAADMMSQLGYATISIDAQYHGERSRPERSGDFHFIDSDTSRDAWIQTVIDLRRAVDYLVSRPDVDARHIGYLGFSQGGIVGGTFLGVEPRIHAGCLAIAGGGLLQWGQYLKRWPANGEGQAAVNAAMTDPVYFIAKFAPRPLLMLSAKRDEMIPRFASDALFTAAGEPKTRRWYNSGHLLPPNAILIDARAFFAKHLGDRRHAG